MFVLALVLFNLFSQFVLGASPLFKHQLNLLDLHLRFIAFVFCCDELSSPSTMPVFLSRKALAEAWVTSGRKIKEMPENLNVMDLGVLVCQMQTDAFAWATLHFVCERKSIALVKESKQGAMEALALPQWQSDSAAPKLEQGGTPAAPASADDEPPPLM